MATTLRTEPADGPRSSQAPAVARRESGPRARTPRGTTASRVAGNRTNLPAAATELVDAVRALDRALRLQPRPLDPPADGSPNVSVAERAALRCLADAPGPLSLGGLSARLHRDPSSASVVVTRLVARRLVRKRPCLDDRRRCLLSVTAAGRRAVAHTPDGASAALTRALAAWRPARARTFGRLLSQLAQRLADEQLGPSAPRRTPRVQ